jgi:ABC-type polysaccharide/polyol phosphate transport system ATPase subunit
MGVDLRCAHVAKRYWIRPWQDERRPSWADRLGIRRVGSTDFWALRDVSFEVARGQVLGVIGRNGAGKSTLFKLLSGITAPTAGRIEIDGRLSALIEVGSGFHPELTGRENVYLAGAILGMSRRHITSNLDAIVEFAGVAPFIDLPVKRYSSGMCVRLGFSVAAHLEPDILLLDEVLAVGDAAFQTKCYDRVEALRRDGITIVLISHDLAAVDRLCDRALLMERGGIVLDGPPRDVIARYAEEVGRAVFAPDGAADADRGPVVVTHVGLREPGGRPTSTFRTGDPVVVRVELLAHQVVPDAVVELSFRSLDDELQCEFATDEGGQGLRLTPGAGAVDFHCASVTLPPGVYALDAAVRRQGTTGGVALDARRHCAMLRVDPGRQVRGRVYMPHDWHWSETTTAINGHGQGAR